MQWNAYLDSVLTEAEWTASAFWPSFDEYLKAALPSFGLSPILLGSLYFSREDISDEFVNDSKRGPTHGFSKSYLSTSERYPQRGGELSADSYFIFYASVSSSYDIESFSPRSHISWDCLLRLIYRFPVHPYFCECS